MYVCIYIYVFSYVYSCICMFANVLGVGDISSILDVLRFGHRKEDVSQTTVIC